MDDFESFEDFWAKVEEFAKKHNISTSYVEEEFIIEGELVPLQPND